MKTYKAVLIEDEKIIKTFEQKTNEEWSIWRFTKAIPYLKPRCQEVRFYIDNVLIIN